MNPQYLPAIMEEYFERLKAKKRFPKTLYFRCETTFLGHYRMMFRRLNYGYESKFGGHGDAMALTKQIDRIFNRANKKLREAIKGKKGKSA
jgi:hypothetical protein